MSNYDEKFGIIISLLNDQKNLRDSRINYLEFLLNRNQRFITTDEKINSIIYSMEEYYKDTINEYKSHNITWKKIKDDGNNNYLNIKNLYKNFQDNAEIYSKSDYEKALTSFVKTDELLNQAITSSELYTNRIKDSLKEEDELISSYFALLEKYSNLQEEKLALQKQSLVQNNYIIQINQYNYNIKRVSPISCYSSTTFGLTTTRCY